MMIEILFAYLVVDALTGIYHLMTDKGFNLQHQVDLFEEHHRTNTMEGFDWQPLVVAIPLLVLGAWNRSLFLTSASLFGCVAQVPHYLAHHSDKSGRVVRLLQATRVIIHPKHHAVHHNGKFNRNYCILSGWNNWWMNTLLWLCNQ